MNKSCLRHGRKIANPHRTPWSSGSACFMWFFFFFWLDLLIQPSLFLLVCCVTVKSFCLLESCQQFGTAMNASREGRKVNLLSGILKWCVYKNTVKCCRFSMPSLRLWDDVQIFLQDCSHFHYDAVMACGGFEHISRQTSNVLCVTNITMCLGIFWHDDDAHIYLRLGPPPSSVWCKVNKSFYKSENLSEISRMLKQCHWLKLCALNFVDINQTWAGIFFLNI